MACRKGYNMFNLGQILRIVAGGIIIALLLLCCFVLSGCKSQQSLTSIVAPASHNEQNDSIEKHYRRDTVFIDRWHREVQRGDTAYIHDSIFFYNGKEIYDTIRIANNTTDTITNIVEVEKQLSKNDVFLKRSGVALWIILSLLILAVIIGIVIKFAK